MIHLHDFLESWHIIKINIVWSISFYNNFATKLRKF